MWLFNLRLFLLQQNIVGTGIFDWRCSASLGSTCEESVLESPPEVPVKSIDIQSPTEVVIFSFSGHQPGYEHNPEYLCDTDSGKLDAQVDGGVAQMVESLQQELADALVENVNIEVHCFADELEDHDGHRGFLSALELWEDLYLDAVHNQREFPKIVMIGHSHGTVWARNLLMMAWLNDEVPNMPVDLLVDIDGVALGWEEPFGGIGDTHSLAMLQEFGHFEYPKNGDWTQEWRPWKVYEAYAVLEGMDSVSIKDIVPPNVVYNMELIAEIPVGVSDQHLNIRWDGSRNGIGSMVYLGRNHYDIRKGGLEPLRDVEHYLFEWLSSAEAEN